ncbi:MAG: sigma-70 family RNA polymerase sigma factor [Clostridiales bacterium]|jgi:RNA polymerase sigma-70 factor (ECF subfamily)|nr:sigma-70 family RNA polymerase sigma factor [Clostridiales bacterium]
MLDFEALYNVYSDEVYRYILSLCRNPHIAEDVTSETLLKAIKAIDKFKGECDMRVWLCQIAKNTYYTLAKRNKLYAEPPDELSSGDNFERALINKSQALEIHRALHRLAEPYKEVFSLRLFSELSFAEIGIIFDKSEGWARTTFHRAKNMLKERVNDG